MATYSTIEDLIIGEISLPDNTVSDKFVQDAADEIDSKLGLIYQTPIVVDPVTYRATSLLLKRINNWLASGRLILAQSVSREEQYVNAYGKSLIEQATAALDSLMNGTQPLPGATLLNTGDTGATGPVINNLDAQSNVESFYAFATSPQRFDPFPQGFIWPGTAKGG